MEYLVYITEERFRDQLLWNQRRCGGSLAGLDNSTIEMGEYTEDDHFDFDLDRNFEWTNKNLIHNWETIGWCNPWNEIDFKAPPKAEVAKLKKRKKQRDLEEEQNKKEIKYL